MKWIFPVCLLMSLQWKGAALAYEADIHFSTTYVLARAAGWTGTEALTIASANQGMDENPHTVAALEIDAVPGSSWAGYLASSVRQAEKNLQFHCFSREHDEAHRISSDVLDVMSGHFAAIPAHDDDPRSRARRLIALGVALHCQQDAHAHIGFGGSCGAHAGSCHGHTYQTLLDQVIFRLLKTHRYNPDHPGVSGAQLFDALQGSSIRLASHRPASARPIPTRALMALSDDLRASGLELPDEVRIHCNRYVAGKWLYDFHAGKLRGGADTLEKLPPEVARTCRNPALASATVVRIPAPRFPRLRADASPTLVRADGSYERIPGGAFPVVLFAGTSANGGASARGVGAHDPGERSRVQVTHWRQLFASPVTRAAGAAANGQGAHARISDSQMKPRRVQLASRQSVASQRSSSDSRSSNVPRKCRPSSISNAISTSARSSS